MTGSEMDDLVRDEFNALGTESLESVIARLKDANESGTTPETVSGPADKVIKDLRASLRLAYQALAECEIDEGSMLRRRLDLVRAFGYPDYETRAYTHYPQDVLRESISAPEIERDRLFKGVISMLVRALPHEIGSRDIIKLATVKKEIDRTVKRFLERVDDLQGLAGVRPEGRQLFKALADTLRTQDPMTDPRYSFGEQLEEIRRAALEAEAARDAAQQAAGQTADATLSGSFAGDAKKDGLVAGALSAGSIVSLFGSFVVGFRIIGDAQTIEWSTEIAKLALTLPLFAVSAYLGRLSTHYREAGRWAKTASVQLKTVDAFAQGFADVTKRDEIRFALGTRIYGDPGFGAQPKNPDVEDVTSIINSVANVVKRQQ